MFGMAAVLVYLVAMGLPLFLLYHYHSQAWYWHSLAVAAAIALGFIPIPLPMRNAAFDLAYGFVFIVLLIWGVCGLLLFHMRHETHA